ncbi:MAG TPA: molybdopterin cofactor-binding domain-containing protein [Xanthobacteraceae bacterium]|nr:molybdopterin cofactor-binding domain-containing protein [Xanthobacteraceae bacterium]
MRAPMLTRRRFSKGLGGLVLTFSLAPSSLRAQGALLPGGLNNNRTLDAWIRIGLNGYATVFTGKVELGQGILTALAQIAAEELDLPLARVRMVSGDTAQTPNEGFTAGSLSVETSGAAIRQAAAEVRAILIELAAKRLNAEPRTLTVRDGVVTAPDGQTLTYGALVAGVNLRREASGHVSPKSQAHYQIVGRSAPRRDLPAKVTGAAAFVHDMRLPGMLHGRVIRPPRYGSTLESIDEAAAKSIPGVVAVVRDGSFLGVVAEREETAVAARDALSRTARWKLGPRLPDPGGIFEHLKSLSSIDEVIGVKESPVLAGGRMFRATYTKPYTAHASIGPSCALAEFRDGRLTVWTHSQGVFALRQELAKALRMPMTAIRCIHAEGAGCFGHNGADDAALDAALLARALPGRPVRLQWMRDDEFAWEPYGPAVVMQLQAALDPEGRIYNWQYELWSNTHSTRPQSTAGNSLLGAWYMSEPQNLAPPQLAGGGVRNAIPLYDFANQRILHHFIPEMPIRVSALRTLGAYANVFAIESFMDELSYAIGADPIAFRLAHLKDPRARAVIESVAALARWRPGQRGDGINGRGLGFARYKNSQTYVAVVARIEVDRPSGLLRIPEMWAAVDAGLIINPDGLVNQIEGGIVQSASWTLYEEVRFDQEGIRSRDWLSYPVMPMTEVPKITVELINRPHEQPLGAGEASLGPAAAAIANAFAHATGRRIRSLPMTAERVKTALG